MPKKRYKGPDSIGLKTKTRKFKETAFSIGGKSVIGIAQKEEKTEVSSPVPKIQRIEEEASVGVDVNPLTRSVAGRITKERNEEREY